MRSIRASAHEAGHVLAWAPLRAYVDRFCALVLHQFDPQQLLGRNGFVRAELKTHDPSARCATIFEADVPSYARMLAAGAAGELVMFEQIRTYGSLSDKKRLEGINEGWRFDWTKSVVLATWFLRKNAGLHGEVTERLYAGAVIDLSAANEIWDRVEIAP